MMVGPAALANTTVGVFQNYPEVSFAMGGAGDWRSFTTVPKLLRQFNPALKGPSTGTFTLSGQCWYKVHDCSLQFLFR